MAAKLKILVINGPNLNMLGKREPDKYGSHSLEHIMSELNSAANSLDVALTHFQSNSPLDTHSAHQYEFAGFYRP